MAMTSALTPDNLVKTPLGGLLRKLSISDEGATDAAKEIPWHVVWNVSEVEDVSRKTYEASRLHCEFACGTI
jgi:hypothetical protein